MSKRLASLSGCLLRLMMTGMLGMQYGLTSFLFSFMIAESISLFAEIICKEGTFMGNKSREKLTQMYSVKGTVSSGLEACRIYRITC